MIIIIPMLNSNITMTVRIAQIEYWPMSWYVSLQNMSKVTIDNASPILIPNMIFRGSDRPISHAFPEKSCKLIQQFFIFSLTVVRHIHLLPSSSSPELLNARSSSLLLPTKVCLGDSILSPWFTYLGKLNAQSTNSSWGMRL